MIGSDHVRLYFILFLLKYIKKESVYVQFVCKMFYKMQRLLEIHSG